MAHASRARQDISDNGFASRLAQHSQIHAAAAQFTVAECEEANSAFRELSARHWPNDVWREHPVQVIDLARELLKDSRLYQDFVRLSSAGAAEAARSSRASCAPHSR
jgi:hypothetical protein